MRPHEHTEQTSAARADALVEAAGQFKGVTVVVIAEEGEAFTVMTTASTGKGKGPLPATVKPGRRAVRVSFADSFADSAVAGSFYSAVGKLERAAAA